MSIRIFQGSLPLLMMFDLPDDVMIDDGCVQGLQEELDVSITIKPKSRQANKTVIIRTQERNGSAIYKVRSNSLFEPTVPLPPMDLTKVQFPCRRGPSSWASTTSPWSRQRSPSATTFRPSLQPPRE